MRLTRLIYPAVTCLLFFNSPMFADEINIDTTEAPTEERSIVGGHKTDSATREEIQNHRKKQLEEMNAQGSEQTQRILRKVTAGLMGSSNAFMLAPSQMPQVELCNTYYTLFPNNCHWLTSISDTGRSLEIEDGSHWEISPSDSCILGNWRRDDTLAITLNSSWFSSYDYHITNKSNNTYVRANLHLGPFLYGPYSHWIVNIDYYAGHVYLENGTIWGVDTTDDYILRNWTINDHIILGLYNSWWSSHDHILINNETNNNVRVKQY